MSGVVRMAERRDAPGICAIYGPMVEESATSFETEPPDEAEMARRVAETLVTHPWIVLCDGADVLGYAYGSRFRARAAYQWSCEVSIYLGEQARGQGQGRRLYRALFELLGRQGYRRAYAGITLPNAASVGLHERMGFASVGVYRGVGFKFGAWHDVGWWQLDLAAGDGPPGPIEPLASLAAGTDWAAF